MAKASDNRWMSIFDAVRHITHFDQYDAWDAEHLIERGLAAGKIRARATAQRAFVPSSPRFYRRRIPGPTPESAWVEIDPEFWTEARFECDDWERERGTATIVITDEPEATELENLELRASEFFKWLRDTTYIPATRSMRGRPRSEAIWTDMVIELVRLGCDGKLNEKEFPDPPALYRWFERRVEDENADRHWSDTSHELDIRSARPILDEIWAKFVSGNRPRGSA